MTIPFLMILAGAALHLLAPTPWDFLGALIGIAGAIWIMAIARARHAAGADPYDFMDSDVFKK